MFLSRVELPWEAVRNPYNIHRWLWRLFPGCVREARASGNEQRQGFLFRVEDTQTGRLLDCLCNRDVRRLVPTASCSSARESFIHSPRTAKAWHSCSPPTR